MSKITTIIILSLFSVSIFGQSITFADDVLILEHPRPEETGLNYPFIPFDYNGDGITDFTGSSFSDQFVYKGLADGSFEEIILTWSQRPIKIIDWDNDGDDDAVFERHVRITQPNDEFFLLNPGVPFGETISDVADINNDSFMDFVTIKRVTFENDEIMIYINNGDDTFEKSLYDDKGGYEVAIFEDVNMDGWNDLIYTKSGTQVALNNGDGSFTKQVLFLNGSDRGLNLKDLDDDGDLDLIVTSDNIYIYFNEGGMIEKSTKISISDDAEAIAIGDFNGDGYNDIVALVLTWDDFRVNLSQNDGTGNFSQFSETIATFPRFPVVGVPRAEILKNNLSVYDYDQDGKLDVIYIDGVTEPNSIRLLRNTTQITSTHEALTTTPIEVFPNPTSQFIEVSTEVEAFETFEIVNAAGKRIKSDAFTSKRIDINELPNGQYMLVLYSKKQKGKAVSTSFIKI